MTARVNRHHYSSGRPYFVVTCLACRSILNSGHHYTERARRHADALADRHNVEHGHAARRPWKVDR